MAICRRRNFNQLLVAGLLIITLQVDEALSSMIKKPPPKRAPCFNGFIDFPPLPHNKTDEIQKNGVVVYALLKSIPKAVKRITSTKDAGQMKEYRKLMSKGEDTTKLLGKFDLSRLRRGKWEKNCKDPNGDPLGLAIKCNSPGLKSKAFGKWRVKKTGEKWKDIVPDNIKCTKNKICLYIVNSNDRLLFEPNDNDNETDTDETKLEVYARKILDGRTTGKTECSDLKSHNFSRDSSAILVSRLSCRNLLDNTKVDACGECGGKGDACKKGCDGELNSKAKKSKCGNVCYGGKASLQIDPLVSNKDCRKYCENDNFKDDCKQLCTSKYKKNIVKDCNGQCSGARRNKCGHCYGGKTNRSANYGIDKCGVCGGKNETCKDCKGVVYGYFRKDNCGKCLDPKSDAFNKCTKIFKIYPLVITSSTQTINALVVTDMKDAKKFQADCKLKNATKEILIRKAEGKINVNRVFKLQLRLPPGKVHGGSYSLTCTIMPGRRQVEFKGIKAIVTDNIKVKQAYPAHGEVDKPLNVTIKGSGFVNIKYIRCILVTSTKQYQYVKARFRKSSEIICYEKKREYPTKVKKLCVQFSDDSPKCTEFHFKGSAPKPKNCSIRTDFVSFEIRFDQPVKASSKCIDLFSKKTYNAILSESAKCQWIKNKEVLSVRNTGSVLNKQSSVEILYKALQNGRAGNSTHVEDIKTIDVKCSQAARVKPLKIELTGTTTQNAGSNFIICVNVIGVGRLQYSWRVQLASGQKETQEIKADIKKLSNKIKRLSKVLKISEPHIPVGATYNFTITVKDRARRTQTASVSLTRTQKDEIPQFRITAIYKSRTNVIRFKIRDLKVKVRCKVEWKCSSNEKIKSNGMSVDIKNPTPGVHKCSARVSTASGSKTISASYTKKSRPLKCGNIEGGRRHVGQNDKTTLKAGSVEDPDDKEATFSYSWVCVYSSGATCILKSDYSEAKFPEARKIAVDMSTIVTTENETLTFALETSNDKSAKKCELTQNITVKRGSPPICKLKIPKTAFDCTKKVVIKATVKSRSSETKYSINFVNRKGFDYSDIETASSSSLKGVVTGSGRRKNPNFIIKPNMLGQKSVYKVRLTCQDTETGEESQAEEDLRTLSKLDAGSIKIDPINGTAGKTNFTVIAENDWELTDQDGEMESSSEDETSQVVYQYGWYYYDKGKKLPQAYGDFSSEDFRELQLPSGQKERNYEVEAFVKACVDEGRKRCVENTTFVTVKPSSRGIDDEVEEADRRVTEAANSDDIGSVHGAVMTTNFQNASENVQEKINDLYDKSLDVATKVVENDMFDEDSEKTIKEIFKRCTQGGQGRKMSKSRKSEVLDSAVRLVKDEEKTSDSKRKRRAVSEQDPMVTEQSPEQVELSLQTHDNLVNMSDYTEDTMAHKKQFIDLAKTLSQSMCKGIENGEKARVAQLSTMVLRSVKNSFEYVHVNYSLTGCDQCETYSSKSAKLLLGETLKNKYDDWDCDGDSNDGCNGACVVSLQMSYDLLLNNTYKGLTRTSDIIDVQLINPKTYQVISVSGLANPVKYNVYLYKGVDIGEADLKCHRWDAGQNKWTQSGVTTLEPNTTDMSVTCAADQLSYITIFDMNGGILPTEETTAASTTAASTTAASANAASTTAATDVGSTAELDTTATATPTATPTNAGTKKGSTSSPATTAAPNEDRTTSSSSADTGVPSSTAKASFSSVTDAQQPSSGTTSSTGTEGNATLKTTERSPTSRTDVPMTTSGEGIATSNPASHPNENTEIVMAFSLGANYDEVVTSKEKKAQLENNIKREVATKLRVKESRIKNLYVKKGSIVVTFTLLPGNNSEPSVKELTDQLKKMVRTGNMTFTSLDGKKLNVIASSFTKQELPSKTTFTNDPANKTGGLKQEILIGIIGGVCVVALIAIMASLYCRFKSKQRIKTCDGDSVASRRSLQGVCNDVIEESDKPSVGVTGIRPSLPGSPIYDNVN